MPILLITTAMMMMMMAIMAMLAPPMLLMTVEMSVLIRPQHFLCARTPPDKRVSLVPELAPALRRSARTLWDQPAVEVKGLPWRPPAAGCSKAAIQVPPPSE